MNKPLKRLGQHYLIDENICRKIEKAFEAKKEDCILEIGSGRGAITKYLAGKGKEYFAVELDEENCRFLENRFADIKVVNQDILRIDLSKLHPRGKLRVIGNIPYNITSEILFKLFDNRKLITNALLMIQEEVARRLTAKPNTKDYGITSVLTQVFTKPKLLFRVSRECFYPKPGVDSRMLRLEFGTESEKEIQDVEFFRKVVRAAFGKRRKTLRNSLKSFGIETREQEERFDFGRRAESLSIEEFIWLSNSLSTRVGRQGAKDGED